MSFRVLSLLTRATNFRFPTSLRDEPPIFVQSLPGGQPSRRLNRHTHSTVTPTPQLRSCSNRCKSCSEGVHIRCQPGATRRSLELTQHRAAGLQSDGLMDRGRFLNVNSCSIQGYLAFMPGLLRRHSHCSTWCKTLSTPCMPLLLGLLCTTIVSLRILGIAILRKVSHLLEVNVLCQVMARTVQIPAGSELGRITSPVKMDS